MNLSKTSNKLYKIIRDSNIREIIHNSNIDERKLRRILSSHEEFFPKIKNIVTEPRKICIKYYDNFTICNEGLYNELKEDNGNTHTFLQTPKTLDICLVENILIYKISDDIVAFGIPQFINFEYVFKIIIIIIKGKNVFDTEFELLQSKFLKELIENKKRNNNDNLIVFEIMNSKNKNVIKHIDFTFMEDKSEKPDFVEDKYKYEEEKGNKQNNLNEKRHEGMTINSYKENLKDKKTEISQKSNITTINLIQNDYIINNTTGDGNCLFRAFSQLIFKSEKYHNNIRQAICDYLKENNNLNEFFDQSFKESKIRKMRKNKTYGEELNISAFCKICDIKLIWFIREITNEKCEPTEDDKITINVYEKEKEGNFAIILEHYIKNEGFNHFSSCYHREGNGISDEKLKEIQEKFLGKEENDDFSNINDKTSIKFININDFDSRNKKFKMKKEFSNLNTEVISMIPKDLDEIREIGNDHDYDHENDNDNEKEYEMNEINDEELLNKLNFSTNEINNTNKEESNKTENDENNNFDGRESFINNGKKKEEESKSGIFMTQQKKNNNKNINKKEDDKNEHDKKQVSTFNKENMNNEKNLNINEVNKKDIDNIIIDNEENRKILNPSNLNTRYKGFYNSFKQREIAENKNRKDKFLHSQKRQENAKTKREKLNNEKQTKREKELNDKNIYMKDRKNLKEFLVKDYKQFKQNHVLK